MNATRAQRQIVDSDDPSHFPADTRTLSLLDQLRAHGYVILDQLVDRGTIDQVNAELAPWFEPTPRCQGDFYGWNTTRVGSVLFKSPASHALVQHPQILTLMEQLLGPHCDWYQLNLSQAIRLHPGERQQIPHRDDEMWPCLKQGIEYMVNVMWALSDFTAENGATMLWPRSQHQRLPRAADASTAVAAQMPRGSALIYLGSVTHCGGANVTRRDRDGLIFSYSLGWLKQYENAFLAYPPDIARSFSKPIRDLLGYRIHRPNLGHCEGQDPAVALSNASRTLATVDALPEAIAQELRSYYSPSTGHEPASGGGA
jgi:ectoine hydroxylase-related dioxygenase (phytanoyl-CoA dioxygenase family)